jgi:GTPase SAR1 family protein
MPEAVVQADAWDRHIESVLTQLSQIYTSRVEPVETRYLYNVFQPTWFAESIKQKKPFITFLGPFSAGKSSFINYLLQGEYLLTGPQPVTDKFTVVMYGERTQQIPGRVLMADARQPFRGLTQFGDSFAECFAGAVAPHPILRSVTFVDTPGILEAAGDAHARRYNYAEVCRWFVEKSDLVFFLFDPTKLDSGPELRHVFSNSLRNQESKIRVVMNKADSVRPQELMRVYGSLYWNLSNLVHSTEPPRLYISSFWEKPYREGTDHSLFEKEKEDLLYELIVTIPLQSLDRRVTSMMQRVRDVLLFALVCATYRTRMPSLFGKSKAKEKFYADYADICKELASRYHVSERNFPSCEDIRTFLTKVDSKDFPDMERLEKHGWSRVLKKTLDVDLPQLLQPIKDHAMSDPKERRNAIMLQRKYIKQKVTLPPTAETNAAGNNTSSPPTFGSPAAAAAACLSSPPPVQASTTDGSPGGALSSVPAAATDIQTQMMQMMQQMLRMQEEQREQQARAASATPPSAGASPNPSSAAFKSSSPPRAAAAPAFDASMQLMIQQMMAMMQQQSQQPSQQPSQQQGKTL